MTTKWKSSAATMVALVLTQFFFDPVGLRVAQGAVETTPNNAEIGHRVKNGTIGGPQKKPGSQFLLPQEVTNRASLQAERARFELAVPLRGL